jgi:hypothetical protein
MSEQQRGPYALPRAGHAERWVHATMKPDLKIEQALVDAFVQKERRERTLFELQSEKRRQDFFQKLDHRYETVLDPTLMHQIPPPNSSAEGALLLLRKLGAPNRCYVLSQMSELDAVELPLHEALTRVVGMGLSSIISCIHGKLAYFEAEQVSGPAPRFILKKK